MDLSLTRLSHRKTCFGNTLVMFNSAPFCKKCVSFIGNHGLLILNGFLRNNLILLKALEGCTVINGILKVNITSKNHFNVKGVHKNTSGSLLQTV